MALPVSVVMPAYNAARWLRPAIDSILSQTMKSFELVVVDDGSSDETPKILHEYALNDPRVRILRQENSGIVTALNLGIDAASGKWIARMDTDDIAYPERLAAQYACAERVPGLVLVAGWCTLIDSEGKRIGCRKYPAAHHGIMRNLEDRRPVFPHPSAFFSKAAFTSVCGYREKFRHAEDVDLWLRLGEKGSLGAVTEPVIFLRKHSDNVSNYAGGRIQKEASMLARICHFMRIAGKQDPAEKADKEWLMFVAAVEKRLGKFWEEERTAERIRALRISHAGSAKRLWHIARSNQVAPIARLFRRRLFGEKWARSIADAISDVPKS